MSFDTTHRLSVELHEVPDVLGDDGPFFGCGHAHQLAIRKAMQLDSFSRRHHIVAPVAELACDLRREVLVQQKPHRKIACSRSAADRSRSAALACRSRMPSISAANAA